MFFYSKVLKVDFFSFRQNLGFGFGGKILVLVNFFSSNSNEKSIEKLLFAAFGKILVLVNVFFYSSSNLKSIENLIFLRYTLHFSDEVIAEFVLPKKYLLELEKYILCMFFKFYVYVFFKF